MVEQIFKLSKGNDKAVERIIFDENVHYLHMVFNKSEGLPEHFSNSNVYMTVVRGILSIGLDEQDIGKQEFLLYCFNVQMWSGALLFAFKLAVTAPYHLAISIV